MCTFQGFRLHSEEAHFGEDLAIKIKMISLLGNYLMEAKLLFIRVYVKEHLLQNCLE